jgi:small subunit ribosomal protein S17
MSEIQKLQKMRTGKALRDAKDKTVSVLVERQMAHPRYGKLVRSTKKYLVHDPENTVRRGDVIEIIECRPLSKQKKWRLKSVIERATLATQI